MHRLGSTLPRIGLSSLLLPALLFCLAAGGTDALAQGKAKKPDAQKPAPKKQAPKPKPQPQPKPQPKAKPKPKAPPRDYYFISDELVRNKDGTLSWFYRTNHMAASMLAKSMERIKLPGFKASIGQRYEYSFRYDKQKTRIDLSLPPTKTPKPDENVVMFTFPAAYKDIVEEFVERFDIPEPQVHIAAKVVEVTLDNNLEYGVSMFFDRGGGDPNDGSIGTNNPNSFFRGFRSNHRSSSFTNKIFSPDNAGLTMVFDDLLSDYTLGAAIEALEQRGAAEILSAPAIVATQGQLASIITGQEIPILEIRTSGTTDTVATTFKETGIRLDFMPLHIGREYVKLRVRVEVSSVTGFVEVTGVATSTSNPIIAQRNAETVVNVRDGMTLAIGGLYSISEIEDKSGVPLLQDIPVLGVLFSNTLKQKVKSELDFFITPTIIKNRLERSVFVPARERRRLDELKKRLEEKRAGKKGDDGKDPDDKEKDAEKD